MSKVQLNAIALLIILSLTTAGAKLARPLSVEGRVRTDFDLIPLDIGDWAGAEDRFSDQTYKLLPTCSLLLRYYQHPDLYAPVELAIVYGTDLGDFHQPEFCLESQGLRTVEKGLVKLKDPSGKQFDAVKLIMEGDTSGRRMFLFWFSSEGTTSTFLGNYKVKIFMDRLLARRVKPSALVRLSTLVVDSDEDSLKTLTRFADMMIPYIEKEFAASSSRSD